MCVFLRESNDDDFKSAVNYNTANCIDSRRVGSRHIDNLANEYLCTRRKSIETGGVCFQILAIIQLGLCVNDFLASHSVKFVCYREVQRYTCNCHCSRRSLTVHEFLGCELRYSLAWLYEQLAFYLQFHFICMNFYFKKSPLNLITFQGFNVCTYNIHQ